ncbi:MAG TPA: hypothetical protein VNQ56_00630 [Pseudolabrys sp.]|nr:hypothetical protein [Pseudolabrys sp.]
MPEAVQDAKYIEALSQKLAAAARRVGMSEAAYYLEIAAASAGEASKRTRPASSLPGNGRF